MDWDYCEHCEKETKHSMEYYDESTADDGYPYDLVCEECGNRTGPHL